MFILKVGYIFIHIFYTDQLQEMQAHLNIELDGVKEWALKMNQMQDVTCVIRDHSASPRQPGDSVESSAEFLLEPCVIIQLPWNPVILRQWLAAALLEVLKVYYVFVFFKNFLLKKIS
jgi:hypothetical protein